MEGNICERKKYPSNYFEHSLEKIAKDNPFQNAGAILYIEWTVSAPRAAMYRINAWVLPGLSGPKSFLKLQ